MRFRQVHLDFHTSPDIKDIGASFDKEHWQKTLTEAAVDSITCFAKCHHGLSYHPTDVGKIHPHLGFDLLRAQIDASHEVGINVPVYISAGVDDVAADLHPEWRELSPDGQYQGWNSSPLRPGFRSLCFRTPYLDYLCKQIEEVVSLYPEADGIFLDIIHQGPCCCKWCMEFMQHSGMDPEKPADRAESARLALLDYYERSTRSCRVINPEMRVFHNSGHVRKGDRNILRFFSHLELESLPTGGWGYDHFPLSASYARNLNLDYLGMTGKFHTTWGEFGGYKHPNALRYECALSMAFGAKCGVGDQLHPSGKLDKSTFRIIGAAYNEVKIKERWCAGFNTVADIGVLSSEAYSGDSTSDTGAGRILLEGHYLFDLIDFSCHLQKYKLLILPDCIRLTTQQAGQIRDYVSEGGKLLLSAESGLFVEQDTFAVDIGAIYQGKGELQPDYVHPDSIFQPDFCSNPFIMYHQAHKVKVESGNGSGSIYLPAFNRTWKHYCSHQHFPIDQKADYPAAVINGCAVWLAHPVFEEYFTYGAVTSRQYVSRVIDYLLGDQKTLDVSLPSTARSTLTKRENLVLHLLYGPASSRGAHRQVSPSGFVRDSFPLEVIEDLPTLFEISVCIKTTEKIKNVILQPQNAPLALQRSEGQVSFTVPSLNCHQMVELVI